MSVIASFRRTERCLPQSPILDSDQQEEERNRNADGINVHGLIYHVEENPANDSKAVQPQPLELWQV